MQTVQQSFEKELFDKQEEIEQEALKLYKQNPEKAKLYLTDYTNKNMNTILKLYTDLRYTLIQKYSNNVLGY
jgi:dipeptidase